MVFAYAYIFAKDQRGRPGKWRDRLITFAWFPNRMAHNTCGSTTIETLVKSGQR